MAVGVGAVLYDGSAMSTETAEPQESMESPRELLERELAQSRAEVRLLQARYVVAYNSGDYEGAAGWALKGQVALGRVAGLTLDLAKLTRK